MSFTNLVRSFFTPHNALRADPAQPARAYIAISGCVMIVAAIAMRQMGTASKGMALLYAGCGASVITGAATRIPALIVVPYVIFSGIATATNPMNSRMFSHLPFVQFERFPTLNGNFMMIPTGFGF